MIEQMEKICPLTPAGVLVDFEKDAFALLDVEVELEAGAELFIAIGEVLKADGSLHDSPGGYRTYRTMTRSCPAGVSRFTFSITPHDSPCLAAVSAPRPAEAKSEVIPFRYVRIAGGNGRARLSRQAFFHDFDDNAAAFSCNDDRLNRLWKFCHYSIKATSALGLFIDGERERCPYEGDAYINQLGWFCCTTDPVIAKRTIDWFGALPTWPVEWRLMVPLIVRDYLLYTGDTSQLREWISWLPARLLPELEDLTHLLRHGNGTVRTIVDWPLCYRDDYVFGEFDFVPNAYFVRALEAMAELTGNVAYAAKARLVRKQMQLRFFRDSLPVDSSESIHTSLHTAVFSLWADIAPDPAPLRELIRSKGMACSVFAAQFLLDVCFEHGMADHAVQLMTADGKHSWFNMIRNGATISMEAWDDSEKPNQDWNHAWGAAPANAIPRRLCGIRPVTAGFRRFVVDPRPGTVTDFALRHPTPHGAVELVLEAGQHLKLVVPDGTEAVFRNRVLPAGTHQLTLEK